MKYIKNNYKFTIVLIFFILLFSIRFPYYIDAPGGINNMNDKIEMKKYDSNGSFNIAYVKEYRATIPTLIISLFNKNWDVIKQEDVLLDNENIEDYNTRDKLFMEEAISNATYVAYKKANKDIKVLSSDLVVLYLDKLASTNLEVGDTILDINETKINSKQDISNIINKYELGESLNIKVKDEKDKYSKIVEIKGEKKLGILLVNINKYKTNPNIKVNVDENESGSSGGLITALAIYNNLIKEDITHGLKIVGTGTIDINGNIGTIGGVSYKLKSAVKENADLFLVPKGENYEEALKIQKEKKYKIKIVAIETFDEAINYLEKIG